MPEKMSWCFSSSWWIRACSSGVMVSSLVMLEFIVMPAARRLDVMPATCSVCWPVSLCSFV